MMDRNELLFAYTKNFTAHHRMFEAEWNRRNTTEITFAQAMILHILATEGPKQAKDLIKSFFISSGGITMIANKLVSLGMIRRSRTEHPDRRAFTFKIILRRTKFY